MTKKTQEQVDTQEQIDDGLVSFIIQLPRPQIFDGKTYTELDLSGLEDLTTEDLDTAEKLFQSLGYTDPAKEFNSKFCLIIAHLATGLSFEFFNSLKLPSAIKIKTVVSRFLYASA